MKPAAPALPSLETLVTRIEGAVRDSGLEPLAPEQLRALAAHLRLLYAWNRRINLTAIRELDAGLGRHTLESLEALPHLPHEGILADLGSGNGFPGLACLVARPELRGYVCESAARKVDFLRAAIREARLGDRVEALEGRLGSPSDLPQGTSVVTMRGFPAPRDWAMSVFEVPTVNRVLAWLSHEDAASTLADAESRGLVGSAVSLRAYPAGALLVLRRS